MSTRPGRINAGSKRSIWLVVRNTIRSSPDVTPSKALRNPENVTDDWYLVQNLSVVRTVLRSSHRVERPYDVPILTHLYSSVKRSVDVFHQNDRPARCLREQQRKLIIGHSTQGQVDEVDIEP